MNDSGCFTAKNITGSPDTFLLACSTLMGERISFVKTFLLISRACLKICNIFFLEKEARLEMFNLASKCFFAKKKKPFSKVSGNLKHFQPP